MIGTPDDAIDQIKRLQEQSGGFGCFLQMAHNWADWQQTQKSYELFARHVAPVFQSRNDARAESYQWAASRHEQSINAFSGAITREIEKDEAEKAAKGKKKKSA